MNTTPLADYLVHEFRQVVEQPTLDELRARLDRHPAMTPSEAPAQAVRAERDRLDRSLSERDSLRVLELLENPPAPNARLLAAAEAISSTS